MFRALPPRCVRYRWFFLTPRAASGTAEFAELMLEVLGDGSAAIAGQHGLVVCGINARRAYGTAIAVEDSARAYLLARQMGFEPSAIPPDTCRALHAWWLANYEQTSAEPLAAGP